MTESRRDGGGPIVAVVLIALALLAMLLTGCAVGPDYKRPDVDLPKDYGVAQAPTPAAERWWSVFGDPTLERLIDEALAANRDLRAAAERVEQSRAQLMVARPAPEGARGAEAAPRRGRRLRSRVPPGRIGLARHGRAGASRAPGARRAGRRARRASRAQSARGI